ncbi:51465549-cd34-4759-bc15-36acf850c449 [Thermothielavioides terrestris]|uniref:51465549-cd34-4759-bc15-36acf850c449 n=1 Tax=Thermothielavioides terrestris TaxID=2587410 RepID=A0A3S4D7V9_9PEZI|nr:51465549-cd34-4759-bc15-36acf850c449 [Thermothielavioides terrestris]
MAGDTSPNSGMSGNLTHGFWGDTLWIRHGMIRTPAVQGHHGFASRFHDDDDDDDDDDTMNNFITGAAMGAALTTAGVYAPDIILSQFKFQDFTMLQTFLSAAAGSTLVVTAAQTLHLTALPPRPCASLGLGCLGTRYDGNLLGGALLGAGMAVSGACPGTVLAQLGVGVASGRWALAGTVLGGTGTVGRGAAEGDGKKKMKEEAREAEMPLTVYDALGVSRGALLVGLEAVLVLGVAACARFANAGAAEARGVPPYLGGLAIAAAQLVSIVLRGSLLGASTGFEELGGWVWGASRKYANVLFSAGVVAGAWIISAAVPALRPITDVAVSPARSVLGGFMIVFGSRMAGGCTSGHGISGLSLMSISSFLTAAAIFGAGGVTGLLMG